MTRILRADQRYRSQQDGIVSWHCFAAGGHYDADNLSFGALLGCDEHVIAPGAGFDWHAHRGVDIVSWVVAGALRHEDSLRASWTVPPGEALVQCAGSGVRHREWNASTREPLRLVQMTLVGGGDDPAERVALPPLVVGDARFMVWDETDAAQSERWHAFVADGSWRLGDVMLGNGDSVRGSGRLATEGSGKLLVWLL